MLAEMTSVQWLEWKTHRELSPMLFERWAVWVAQLLMTLWDIAYSVHGKVNPKGLEDFRTVLGDEPIRVASIAEQVKPEGKARQQGDTLKMLAVTWAPKKQKAAIIQKLVSR